LSIVGSPPRDFGVVDDRTNRKRQLLLIIEATVALRASVRRHDARKRKERRLVGPHNSRFSSVDDNMIT
jgi:hypothetical protein